MKTLLILLALTLPNAAFAQTNCPGTSYLGWGYGWNPYNVSQTTNLIVSFPSGAGSATCAGPFAWDQDLLNQTCDPTTWNGKAGYPKYGTVTYNDGTISYTGQARFWWDLTPATSPYCYEGPGTSAKIHYGMFKRLKIQSCTNGHVLTNRFIAVSCDGSYCESVTNVPCDTNYAAENWMNLTVSGF